MEPILNLSKQSTNFKLSPFDNRRLATLCGQFDEHIRHIENRLTVHIVNRGDLFEITGQANAIAHASQVLKTLYTETAINQELSPQKVHLMLEETKHDIPSHGQHHAANIVLHSKEGAIRARSVNQQHYLQAIEEHVINFGIGPAGTGKTFLAVAAAIQALEQEQVKRIILVRPVVEAGESLGFLPGDLAQKIDPYLRPLYDAFHTMVGLEKFNRWLERNQVEIAPLAYMRGRTLDNAFIILDESQNCSKEQMKMFLTRIGFGSQAVITGDLTQIDLPKGKLSGLRHAIAVLRDTDGIQFNYLESCDVIRHPLVQAIIDAYEQHQEPKT